MVAFTPSHGWPYPTLGDTADAFAAFQAALAGVEATIDASGVQAYTPTWSADNTQPSNLLTATGRYRLSGGYCQVSVFLAFGASTNGGSGALHVSLPLPASANITEQTLLCKIYLPIGAGGTYLGFANVLPGGVTCSPFFPTSAGDCRHLPWQSADASGANNTGHPLVPSQFSVQNGGNFALSGRYLTV